MSTQMPNSQELVIFMLETNNEHKTDCFTPWVCAHREQRLQWQNSLRNTLRSHGHVIAAELHSLHPSEQNQAWLQAELQGNNTVVH
jgi:hypothetical protein